MKTIVKQFHEFTIKASVGPHFLGEFCVIETNFQEDDKVFQGSIKPDGCSNWHFNPYECFHACDRQGLLVYGEIMQMCWDMMPELIGDEWGPI